MGRPSLGRRIQIVLRVPDDLYAQIEAVRGLQSRQDWLLRAVRLALSPKGQVLDPELKANIHTHDHAIPVSTEYRDGIKIRTFACACGDTTKAAV